MSSGDPQATITRCPSAQPDMPEARVLGVVGGSHELPVLDYLEVALPVSNDLLALTDDVEPTRVLRFSARCEELRCAHFDGQHCALAQRIVRQLPPVVDQLPDCNIRDECRWYLQEGPQACRRCPQVTTLSESSDPVLVQVAMPAPRAP